MTVQRLRYQFLADAGLTGNQDGQVGTRQPADGAKYFLHRRGRANDFVGCYILRRHSLQFRGMTLYRPFYQAQQLIYIKRFGQVFISPSLERRNHPVQVRKGGHNDNGQIGIFKLDLLQQGQAVQARHPDI